MSLYVAEVSEASKLYKSGDTIITALQPTNFRLNKRELVLLLGPSGSGKTTLLSMLGCVMYPTSGEVFINGHLTNNLKESALAKLRLRNIGFVFQSYNLIAPLNALENVMLPLQLMKVKPAEARKRAMNALEVVNMIDRMKNLPKNLSGGQQQRVAIARALVTNPLLILCDEPTGALDPQSVSTVMGELKGLVSDGKTVVIVTHDMRLTHFADRIYKIDNGYVTELNIDQLNAYKHNSHA